MNGQSILLKDFWYLAAIGKHLKKGKTVVKTILGNKILIGRDLDNNVFALRDFCPHRGIPLSYGRFDGKEIECCYHGWCFNTQGQCTKIPSLTPDATDKVKQIKAGSFPCQEVDGNIWVFIPAGKNLPDPMPEIPAMPEKLKTPFYWVDSVNLPCNIDHAVIGLMDPAHGPFVHQSWWWRSQKSIHLKQKNFEPTTLGFKMVSHKPSSNSRAYKILGSGDRKTEIQFSLPCLRTEHITIGDKHIVLLTALTPVDENNTVLHQFIYSNIGLAKLLFPILRPFGRKFIGQDLDIVTKQQEGLSGDAPSLLLIPDADTQALWYFKLKREYLTAQQEGKPFVNSIKPKVLKWRS